MKNKIILISKELECISLEKISLKNALDSHICHATIASSSCISIAYSTSSSTIDTDIHALTKSVDCLVSTLSQCAMNHTRLESIFQKKHAPHMHAHFSQHTHASHVHTYDTMYANVYTCTNCGGKVDWSLMLHI